eukprot:m.793150 g.793150  ORF g.793150 m.793150 type:complete len:230 (+) comp23334_c0_seq2:229-918(+)
MDDLATYRVELEQVQAALSVDPENAELKKLESDLKEIIELSGSLNETTADVKPNAWAEGDICEAIWSNDGAYYKARIDSINGDGMCKVTFLEYDENDTVKVSSLRQLENASAKKRQAPETGAASTATDGKTRAEKEAERERKKRRREKKKEKMEEKEKTATKVASSWQKFNTGRSAKSKTGFLSGKQRESIFKSPDGPDGKVGVGTCGIGGKGMTDFQKRDKWTYSAGN